jgi:ABC-type molybdate transport system ATPase subunit
MNLGQAVLTEHAINQMVRRRIMAADVSRILAEPEQVINVRPGRVVAQGMAGEYLLRVFVDIDRSPAEVVTIYRTSKMEKYRNPS